MTEIILDRLALISEGKDKVFVSELRIILHNVPEDGMCTDINHRLGTKLRLLAKPGAFAAAEYDDFHVVAV